MRTISRTMPKSPKNPFCHHQVRDGQPLPVYGRFYSVITPAGLPAERDSRV